MIAKVKTHIRKGRSVRSHTRKLKDNQQQNRDYMKKMADMRAKQSGKYGGKEIEPTGYPLEQAVRPYYSDISCFTSEVKGRMGHR